MRNSSHGRRGTLFVLAFALASWSHWLAAQEPPARPRSAGVPGNFRIAGVVVSQTTGTPLARTRVSIIDARNPRDARWMVTTEDGHFAFERLSPGKYSLQGARRGFIPTTYEQHGQFSTAIVTGAGVDTENLTLRLVPSATLTGKVLDESGEPVRNANVRLFRENHSLGVSQVTSFGSASTDDQGTYEFAPVIPGIYFVSATARPWYAIHPFSSAPDGSSIPAVDASLDVSYPSTYYSGTTEPDSATPVPIHGGDHLQIDIHLEPVASLHLFLHVPENGQGVRWPVFQKRVFDTMEGSGAESGQQLPGGRFEMTGIPPGRYTVRLQGSSSEEPGQITEVNLTKDGQELDSFAGESLSSLKLSVKMAGEEKLPQQLAVMLRDAHAHDAGFQQIDGNGEAHFENLPAGKYSVMAFSSGLQYSVVRTSSQGIESAGNKINVTPGTALSISAVLLGGATRVEGFVKREGKPAPGVMVVLVPADPESNIEFFRRDQSDLDGSFVLPGVVPGSYTVIAIENGWTMDWSRPAVVARYAPHGQKVSITSRIQGQKPSPVRLTDPVEVQPR
jgi:Carboxypeptidase regulatory-like domain